MLITNALRDATSEHEIYFLLTAYVEAVRYCDKLNMLPPAMKDLPVSGAVDVVARMEALRAGLGATPVKSATSSAKPLISSARRCCASARSPAPNPDSCRSPPDARRRRGRPQLSPNRRQTFTRGCHIWRDRRARSLFEENLMTAHLRFVPALLLAAALSAHAQDASIRVGGSTTALPIISSCAAHFMEKHRTWDKAEAGLGKEQTVVYVTGGGSGFGVKGLMNGTIDLGLVSRDLRDSEMKTLGGPVTHVFARDAVAIATSATSPLQGQAGVHQRRAGRHLLRPGAAVLADRQPAAREGGGAAGARRERRRHRDLPGARDEEAAAGGLAAAVSLHRRAHQEAGDQRGRHRLRLRRRRGPGRAGPDLRG